MEAQILNTHKKYNLQYLIIERQIYSTNFAMQHFFKGKAIDLPVSKLKKIKPFRYPSSKNIIKLVNYKTEQLFEKLDLKSTKNSHQNQKIITDLLNYFFNNINTDMTIIEDRLNKVKKKKEVLFEELRVLEESYSNRAYNKDRAFKKIKNRLKKIEKITKIQNDKILYNTLVRKKTSPTEDNYTFMYLLNKLNIKAYLATLNKDAKKEVILVPINLKPKQMAKYFILDLNKYRLLIEHPYLNDDKKTLEKDKNIIILENKQVHSNDKIISIQDDKDIYFSQNLKFKKAVSNISKEKLQLFVNTKN